MRLFLATLVFSCAAFSQQPVAAPVKPPPMTPDDAVAIGSRISERSARIEPMLEQLRPNDWIAKGAPDTYLAQWNSTREQFRAIRSDMSALAQHPDHLSESMNTLFRVQSTQQILGSLMGGVRKYQNPALADLIESVAAEASGDIDRLERYLLQLSDEKEQQLTLVDHEAQRCRGSLSRQPAEPARPNRRTQ
jgi:hypothetical protein